MWLSKGFKSTWRPRRGTTIERGCVCVCERERVSEHARPETVQAENQGQRLRVEARNKLRVQTRNGAHEKSEKRCCKAGRVERASKKSTSVSFVAVDEGAKEELPAPPLPSAQHFTYMTWHNRPTRHEAPDPHRTTSHLLSNPFDDGKQLSHTRDCSSFVILFERQPRLNESAKTKHTAARR